MTLCRRELQETPTHVQKEALPVQLLTNIGSSEFKVIWDLKARRASSSVRFEALEQITDCDMIIKPCTSTSLTRMAITKPFSIFLKIRENVAQF